MKETPEKSKRETPEELATSLLAEMTIEEALMECEHQASQSDSFEDELHWNEVSNKLMNLKYEQE